MGRKAERPWPEGGNSCVWPVFTYSLGGKAEHTPSCCVVPSSGIVVFHAAGAEWVEKEAERVDGNWREQSGVGTEAGVDRINNMSQVFSPNLLEQPLRDGAPCP